MNPPDRLRPLARLACALLACLPSLPAGAQPAPDRAASPLDRRIDEIARHVDAARADASVYAPPFVQAVPIARLNVLYADIRARGGEVVEVTATGSDSPWSGRFRFRYAEGFENDVTLTLDATEPHQVIGLWFGPLRPTVGSFDEIIEQLAELPGRTNFMLAELVDGHPPRPIASHQPDLPLAVGSTFKLYVLAALRADGTPWDRVVYLREAHRSLPSGVLQDWPADTPMTVFSLAAPMISISDNTATDALIDLVGRDRLAELMPRFGNKHPELNTPFLSTYELFKLRADPALAERYARADAAERLRLLDGEVAAMPRERVQPLMDRPRDIDRIEWFASAADLTRLLAWLNDNADETAREIMGINPGLTFAERFVAVGYKGGSEAGVLNLTWLLETASSRVYTLTLGWNDGDRALDEGRLVELAHAAAMLVAEEPGSAPGAHGPPAE